ncbi:hypothetical protein KBD33_06775 [Candidatus Gracilibacteria bacterium]|nr:hypothetical protein [Candidatus Gracilibacteria bacterium]
MQKIKEIYDRIHKNPSEYTNIRFLTAQRVFITIVALYFTSFLFTIGGYYFSWFDTKSLSMLTFHLYSIMVISTVWFGFSIAEYFTVIYLPKHNWIPYFALCLLFVFGLLALYVHLQSLI